MEQHTGEHPHPNGQRPLSIGPLDYAGGLSAILLSCMVFYESVMRYLFGISIAATQDIAMILLAGISFFGAATAHRDKQHLAVTFIAEKMFGEHANIPAIVVRLINLAFFGILVFFGIKLFLLARMTRFAFLHISKAILYLIFLVGIVAMIYYECVDIFKTYVRR